MKSRIFCAFFSLLLTTTAFAATTPSLIPLPQQMQVRAGQFTLCPSQTIAGLPARSTTRILVDGASQASGEYLAALLLKSTGYQFPIVTNLGALPVKGAILLTTVNAKTNLGAEGYELTVAPDSVVIRAPTTAGVFYGIQSFLQLLPPQIVALQPVAGVAWTAPCVYIQDQPRFVWRGMMLDCSRHFYIKQEIKQILDAMAFHKLNTFHWHLVDDQGWRIQILKYPLLTQVGAWRNGIDYGLNPRGSLDYNASNQYGGFYTQSDIREIVAYAQQRHITIVPEIEMPGHSTAGLAAYPQYSCSSNSVFNMDVIDYHIDVYSPGTPGTFQFLEDILTEVIGLFPGQYIHCGGDEVTSTIWNTNAPDKAKMQSLGITPGSSTAVLQYQSWFSTQIADFLHAQGRTMIGWSEIEYGGVLTNAAVMDWLTGTSSQAVTAASAGKKVVMSPNLYCYYNYYQSQNFAVEPMGQGGYCSLTNAYNFEPVPASLPSQYISNILGGQANLWGEYLLSLTNSEFRIFPRLCALAEVTWTPAAMKNFTNFTARLATHEQRLVQMGVNYDHEAITQIGNWTPAQITATPGSNTLSWDITTNLIGPGEVNVNFWFTAGANGLNIYSAALLENGVQVDIDTHAGFTGSTQTFPIYILNLPVRNAGATYTIQATVAGKGGTNSTGTVYLPNWN